MCVADTSSEFIVSFDGSSTESDEIDDEDGDRVISYCLVSKHLLEKTSLVIRNQLDASDKDLGKLQVADVASVSPVLPSPSLSQLMWVSQNLQRLVFVVYPTALYCLICLQRL